MAFLLHATKNPPSSSEGSGFCFLNTNRTATDEIPKDRHACSALVYLDIDGVIVTDRSTKLSGAGYIPPGAASMVVDILDRTGARLVAASTWRRDADCRAKLARAGIGQDRYFIDWRTPDLSPEEETADLPIRGSEIDRHLQRHQPGTSSLMMIQASCRTRRVSTFRLTPASSLHGAMRRQQSPSCVGSGTPTPRI
jgi:hypothetical protein